MIGRGCHDVCCDPEMRLIVVVGMEWKIILMGFFLFF